MKQLLILYSFIWCIAAGCNGSAVTTPPLLTVGDINATEHNGKMIRLQGTVKTGAEVNNVDIQTSCPEQHYLVDNGEAWMPLGRGTGEEGIVNTVESEFLNSQVEVVGKYMVFLCEHICCDSVLVVDSITLLKL